MEANLLLMNPETFKSKVEKTAQGTASQEVLAFAINDFVVQGKCYGSDVSDCAEAARMYDLESREKGDQSTFHLPPDAFPTAHGEYFIKQVEPWIESIREEVFGESTAPFNSYETAVAWVKSEAKKIPQLSGDDLEKLQKIDDKIHKLVQKRNHIRRFGMTLGEARPLILYGDYPDPYMKILSVTSDKPLGPVANGSKEISDFTGFRQVQVIAWILVDIKPSIPGARMEEHVRSKDVPGAGEINVRRATIEIFSPEVKISEITALARTAQKNLQPVRISALQKTLLKVMEEVGDLPEGRGTTSYWNTIMSKFNQRFGDEEKHYKNWRGVWMAYKDLDEIYKQSFPRLQAAINRNRRGKSENKEGGD